MWKLVKRREWDAMQQRIVALEEWCSKNAVPELVYRLGVQSLGAEWSYTYWPSERAVFMGHVGHHVNVYEALTMLMNTLGVEYRAPTTTGASLSLPNKPIQKKP